MKKLGFIVNPVAGIGGKVGLKGSDGKDTLAKALALGAKPESGLKAKVAVDILKGAADQLDIYTCPAEMGADILKEAGLSYTVVGEITPGATTPQDTVQAAQSLRELGLDLILFAGGDGTARNIMDAVGDTVPVLGIPAGCKIHSAVYAVNPRSAGELVVDFANGLVDKVRSAEVMDIDEDLFRQGIVEARLYGYLNVPNEKKFVQDLKSGSAVSDENSVQGVGLYIMDHMEPDVLYIMGSGSTIKSIMDILEMPATLLGIDLVYGGKVICADATEKDILAALDQHPRAKVIVTVIGGQGYVFGRGNQQLSAAVLKRVGKDNIIIAADQNKMLSLIGKKLYVDTGDQEVNDMLKGYYRVVVGYDEMVMFPVID